MKKRLLTLLLTSVVAVGCSSDSALIQDKAARKRVAAQIAGRADWLPATPEGVTPAQKEAMDFLYAYMPVGDVADYPVDLYLANVKSSLQAIEQMPWGATVPNELFLHYVLPVRINNENLDTSRVDFYAELRDRVKGLSMADAILEVNHWCHEKVIYVPSDGRTMSPSALVRNAQGRCGEESTFTVAALRAVGIPARQVYTPRWAHTDDNHAWVEAWADGKWYYFGACEPEPVLDMGWFDAPSRRGMLMHTKVFGQYVGPEEVISSTPLYTEINVTDKYAPVATAVIEVVDSKGAPVADADLDFGIYNYAEFYPAVRKKADANGRTTMTAGLGDMIVWATNGSETGFGQLSFGKQDTLRITIAPVDGATRSVNFDIVPPVPGDVTSNLTDEQRAANTLCLNVEDSIRGAYIASWVDEDAIGKLASTLGADKSRVTEIMRNSRGNWQQIAQFLNDAAAMGEAATALQLLEVVSTKDLQDTPADVLSDHLRSAVRYKDQPFFVEYILNPRIDRELLTPYRAELGRDRSMGIAPIIERVGSVEMVDSLNPARIPISPLGVHHLGKGDVAARERYFIASARSKGIPARREPVTNRLQYYDTTAKEWVNVTFGEQQTASAAPARGTLMINYTPSKNNADPKYYTHFTIAKLKDGRYSTIDLSTPEVDMGGAGSLLSIFKEPVHLEEGDYMLVTGTRMASGTVLSEARFFRIAATTPVVLDLTMREDVADVQVIGSMNPEAKFLPAGASEPQSILATTGRGYFVLAILEAKKEPTNHSLRDIAALKSDLEKWGRGVVMLYRTPAELTGFNASEFGAMPSNVTFGSDNNGEVLGMLVESLKIKNPNDLPIFVIADTFGRVVFFSQGYRIGLGEQMMNVIKAL